MSKIFISHSSINNASALAIAQWLEDNGWKEYFLDITPAQGLSPGERWQEALKKAADRCEIVLFLISPAWRNSKWCLAEFFLAKQLGKRLFGVLIQPTPINRLPREMTAECQLASLVHGKKRTEFTVHNDPLVLETTISFADTGLALLKRGLQKAGLASTQFEWPPKHDPNRAPYRGLKALEAEDAAVFFGREAAIVRGLDKLRLMRNEGVERLFVVLGASGSGKSSYLRAGLYPRLERDDRHFLPLPVIRPEKHVITGPNGLINSLCIAFEKLNKKRNLGDLRQVVGQPGGLDRLMVELQTAAQKRLLTEGNPPTIVLSIDQGEELFGTYGRDEAEVFLSMLSGILSPPHGDHKTAQSARRTVLGIIAIQSNLYDRLQTAEKLAAVKHNPFNLKPVTRDEFKTIIEGPAKVVTDKGQKLVIDPTLTEQLLLDSAGADALPLLALTLERLYREYGKDGDLVLEEYEKLGGVRGSIENAINRALENPDQPPTIPSDLSFQSKLLRQTFIPWLASIDPQTGLSQRRVADREKMPEATHPFLDRLIAARLLTQDRRIVDTQGYQDQTTTVEVSHEALLRQWPTLRMWLDQDEDQLKITETVRHCATEWEREGRDNDWLDLRGERLKAAEDLIQQPALWKLLGQQGQEYIGACRSKEDQAKSERESTEANVHRTSQALQEANIQLDRLAAIAHESPSPIVELDRHGSVLYLNPAMSALLSRFGYSLEGFPNVAPAQLMTIIQQCLSTGQILLGEEVILPKASFLWTFCPVLPHEVVRAYATDMTSMYETQQVLQQTATQLSESNQRLDLALEKATESARVKSSFLATVGHELRTPMDGVIRMASLLMDTSLTSKQQSCVETIRQCGATELQLINDIVEMANLEAGKLEVKYIDFNLRTTVEQALAQFAERAETKGIELTGLVHAAVPTGLKGDPGRLRQVLSNLVANAVKFTDKGEVSLQAYLENDSTDTVEIRFEVTDSGIGMSSTTIDKLFCPFVQADSLTTRKYGGTGLGLSISKQLVELMGGRIEVRSIEGHGSTFWCTARFQKQIGSLRAILPSGELAGKRVLIVDDNESNRMILHHLVSGWGMLDDLAEDAESALHHITEAAEKGIPYALAILDAVMPGKDGIQLARDLQSHPAGSRIRLVLMTSMLQRDYVEQVHRVGVMGYVPKPVRHDDLRDCIRTVLGLI